MVKVSKQEHKPKGNTVNKQQRTNIETFGLAQLQDHAAKASSIWANVVQKTMGTDQQPLCGDMYTRIMHDATSTTPAQHTRNSLWSMVRAKDECDGAHSTLDELINCADCAALLED